MSIVSELDARLAALDRAYYWREIDKRTYEDRKDHLLAVFHSKLASHETKLRYSTPVNSRFELKSGRGDKLELRATTYMRTPNLAGAVVLPRSCENVPDDFADEGEIFWEHDTSRPPIANVVAAKQNGDGIDVIAKWSNSAIARDTRTVLRERARAGKPNYVSAGLRIPASGSRLEWCGNGFANVIESFTLDEVSLVKRPADDLAIVTRV
jgi:hypothetical protein